MIMTLVVEDQVMFLNSLFLVHERCNARLS